MIESANKILKKIGEKIEEQHIITGGEKISLLSRSISDHQAREILAVLKPQSTEQLIEIIRLNYQADISVPLFPLSTGRNWGYGSRNPVIGPCFLLDLSDLNKIHFVDKKKGIALIEPGVTQGQLIDAISGSGYKLNVTNSVRDSSIIGNALDRGIGTSRYRSEDILACEIVTGDAEVLHIGALWPITEQEQFAFHYSNGIGPNLLGLLYQSNFSVVTKAAISLIPETEVCAIIKADFSAQHIAKVYQLIRELYDQNIVNTYFKIYDLSAAKNYGLNKTDGADFLLYGSLETSNDFYPLLKEFVLNKFNHSALFNQVDIFHEQPDSGYANEAEQIIHETFQGINNISSYIENLFEVSSIEEVDTKGNEGWLFFVVVIPAEAEPLTDSTHLIEQFRADSGLYIAMSIKCPKEKTIDINCSIRFKRNDKDIALAHQTLKAMQNAFEEKSYYLYRRNIDMQNGDALFRQAGYYEKLLALKNIFDPKQILSPGRYIGDMTQHGKQ